MKKIVGVFLAFCGRKVKKLSDKYKDIADVSIYSLKKQSNKMQRFSKCFCSDLDKADIMILNLASSAQISSEIKNYITDNKTKKYLWDQVP